MPAPAAVEFLPRPSGGRVFTDRRRVRLGDVDRRGRLRLDATARFLQDIATDDADDAGLDRRFGWLVRRTCVETRTPARLGEHLDVATWCTGLGRSWAERRSTVAGDRGARIDAVSLWVQIDVTSGKPARIGDDFTTAYGPTAAGRSVSARLSLPGAPPSSPGHVVDWHVRRSDLDPFAHVNNAANWAFLEDAAALDVAGDADDGAGIDPRVGTAEMEYLQPVTPGVGLRVVLTGSTRARGGLGAWLTAGDTVLTAARWRGGTVALSGG